MRIVIISTYPPRACGIATFSQDLRTALVKSDPSVQVGVVAVVRDAPLRAAPEVIHVIRQDVRGDYLSARDAIAAWRADVVLIEHEYGIFGGDSGSHVLTLARGLAQPFVVTLHTVLSRPTERQSGVLTELCALAAAVTVFTETARRMVVDAGIAAWQRTRVVPHGAPIELVAAGRDEHDGHHGERGGLTEPLHERVVLSTFGLISSGKGIETAIAALPPIIARHPRVLYLIAGQTHPDVVRSDGERYRRSLERLVVDLHLQRHVRFLDRFLTLPELASLLASTDLYLTPYRSREQIVSGALTFAVAAGCPVVSTPYYYAEDLLATGAGVIVPFDDPAALAAGVLDLLRDPAGLRNAASEARRIGTGLVWPAVAARTVEILRGVGAARGHHVPAVIAG